MFQGGGHVPGALPPAPPLPPEPLAAAELVATSTSERHPAKSETQTRARTPKRGALCRMMRPGTGSVPSLDAQVFAPMVEACAVQAGSECATAPRHGELAAGSTFNTIPMAAATLRYGARQAAESTRLAVFGLAGLFSEGARYMQRSSSSASSKSI